jgi:hypothetical protein
VTLGLLGLLLLVSAGHVRVEAGLLWVVEGEPSCDEDGIEEKRDADHDDRSLRVSFRRDNRGGRMERTDGRGLREELPLKTTSSSSVETGPASPILCFGGTCRNPPVGRGGTKGGVSETEGRRRDTVSPFASGSGQSALTGVRGIGDLRDVSSKYTVCEDPSSGGGVVLTTRNGRRGGVWARVRRSRSLLPGRDGGIRDLARELLGVRCSTCTGVGCATGTAGTGASAGTGTDWIGVG